MPLILQLPVVTLLSARGIRGALAFGIACGLAFGLGCAPAAHIPARDLAVPGALPASSPGQIMAETLAPVLYVQRDEPFPLLRVVAVIHPTRPIVAYHLLWAHDVNGQWVPWSKPSDEEVVWVGYDPLTRQASDLWTYWHGAVLHTGWPASAPPTVDVQWGKHGSLPHGIVESDLPRLRTLNAFYAIEFLLLPDIALGKLAHGGPWGFFHSYARYRDYAVVTPLRSRLDAVVRARDPRPALQAVFGVHYSNKRWWPD